MMNSQPKLDQKILIRKGHFLPLENQNPSNNIISWKWLE